MQTVADMKGVGVKYGGGGGYAEVLYGSCKNAKSTTCEASYQKILENRRVIAYLFLLISFIQYLVA